MGVIQEELRLADQFSQTFRAFDAAANASINVAEEFQKALNGFSEGFLDGLINSLQDSRNELGRMADEADDAKNAYVGVEEIIRRTTFGIEGNTKAEDNFNESVKKSEKSAGNLMGTISKIAGAIGVVKLAENFIQTSDELSQISAKLNMINDGSRTTAQLQEAIYESAQRSRGSYLDTANLVARLGMNAGDAFKTNAEMLQFAENLNKAFTIAGASAQEQASVILQMSQALGSGVLRGQEFNAVMAGAPNIMQYIADSMNLPKEQLRDMAAEGQITANVVVKAMLGATNQINSQFQRIPKTFSDIITTSKNRLIAGLEEVFNDWASKLNESQMQEVIDNTTDALIKLAEIGGNVLIKIADLINFMHDNWETIAPIIEVTAGAVVAFKVLNVTMASAVQTAWATAFTPVQAIAGILAGIAGTTVVDLLISPRIESDPEDIPRQDDPMPALQRSMEYDAVGKVASDLGLLKSDVVYAVLNGTGLSSSNLPLKDLYDATYKYKTHDQLYPKVDPVEEAERIAKRTAEIYERYTNVQSYVPLRDRAEKYGLPDYVTNDDVDKLLDAYVAEVNANRVEDEERKRALEEIKDHGVKVRNEVKLSDEDLQIFRDIAENRYIANVSLETLAPSVSVNVENNGQNMSEDDIASAVTKALETQISEHTAISHG